MINRLIAAGATIGFLTLVKPDPNPSLWGVGLTAIMIYEGTVLCVSGIRKYQQKRKEQRYTTVSLSDIRRWADTELYHPIEEVIS